MNTREQWAILALAAGVALASAGLDRAMEPVGGVVAPELPSGSSKGAWVSVLIWRKRA